ncbi:MAG: cytochrome C oxidase subunit IV family protein [Candidatus Zixiibacteriota bacterium]|nr:MAG: cytochrome C oxidase subunit IV family protein [candidate division Zixibacteria bacterium]
MKNGSSHSHHILPPRVYLGVGAALLILTAITVAVSFFNFGPYNLLVAMLIAAGKASLVALFFMHLKYDNKLYMTIFVASVVFLAVFIILTMFDTLRRDDIYDIGAGPIRDRAVMYDSVAVDSTITGADSIEAVSDTTINQSPGQ